MTQILLLLSASVLAVTILRRLKMPAILGYLLVGLLLGPHAFGWVEDQDQAHLIAEFGVVFLLFTLGLEFSLPRLLSMRREVAGLGGAQVILTTLLGAGIAWWLGVSMPVAIILGGALAMSSTAIVIKQLSEQGEISHLHGRYAVGILLFQDIAVIPFLVLIPLISAGNSELIIQDMLVATIQGVGVLVTLLAVGRWALKPLFREISHGHVPELFTLTVLLVSMAAAWLTHEVGLSLALGAFLAGMMLGETEYRHLVEADIRPFRDVLLGLFFITIGMLIDPAFIVSEFFLVGLSVMLLVGFKTGLNTLLARQFCQDWHESLRTGLVVAQGGEFGFALITLALQGQIVDPSIAQPVLATLVLSMALSPLIIRYNGPITKRVFPPIKRIHESLKPEDIETESSPRKRAHVIVCGFGRVGQNIARFLEREGFEYIALDMDPYRVQQAREAGDPVYYGDSTQAEILNTIGLQQANAVVISFADTTVAQKILHAVKSINPDVPILVRAMDDTDLDNLISAGATEVIPETLEASLVIASHLLLLLDTPFERVMNTVQEVRDQRYGMLRNIFRKSDALPIDSTHSLREQLHAVTLDKGAYAVGKTLDSFNFEEDELSVTAIKRDDITGRQPTPETEFRANDVVVLYGTPEALELGEKKLLQG